MENLESKAINIKGKKYVLVADRVVYFNEAHPQGSITTELLSPLDADYVIVKATVKPDNSTRLFTGYSQAKKDDGYINKTSALENAETSAVGRALAMMGIGVIDSVASVDELAKASQTPKTALGRTEPPKVDIIPTKVCSVCKKTYKVNPKAPNAIKCYTCWRAEQEANPQLTKHHIEQVEQKANDDFDSLGASINLLHQ